MLSTVDSSARSLFTFFEDWLGNPSSSCLINLFLLTTGAYSDSIGSAVMLLYVLDSDFGGDSSKIG